MDDPVAPARERGWGTFLAALVAWLLVPATPLLNVITPIEQTWVLLVPAVATCMLVGWWGGGRLSLALIWAALAVWMLALPIPGTSAGYDKLARGWSLLLAGVFGIMCLLGGQRGFFTRALTAVAIVGALAGSLWVARSSSPRPRDLVMAEMTDRNALNLNHWETFRRRPYWRGLASSDSSASLALDALDGELRALPRVAGRAFIGLLALESLVSLALAWALYHRLSRARIGTPLALLKDFRFSDQLVWGMIVGAILVLLPGFVAWRTVGINLLVFFGALYVVRGFGIISWMAPSPLVMALMVGLAVFGLPILGAVALGLGLGDTWVDWRSRPRPTTQS